MSFADWKRENRGSVESFDSRPPSPARTGGEVASPLCRLVPANVDGPFDPPKWLWEGRVPLGELTIVAGRGEVGKTTIVLDLVAQLSRGELAGDRFGQKGKTVFFSDEASFDRVISPRYAAAGGSFGGLYGVEIHDTVDRNGEPVSRPFRLDSDMRILAETVADGHIDLLVFDPIDMLLGGIDSHRNNAVRAALNQVMSAGCTVIGIQHVTKGSNVSYAGDRIMGSVAFRNFPRSVLMAEVDRADPDLIVLAHDKSNYGPRQKSLMIKRMETGTEGFVRLEWLGEISTTADDLLIGRRGPSRVQQCSSWLQRMLSTNGPLSAKSVVNLAQAEGYGRTTVYEARGLLGITTGNDRRWKL